MKKNTLFAALLSAIIIIGLFLGTSVHLGKAQSGTNVSGIIASDTTWTPTNSPYSLTGNILVNNGALLKIEAGTTVNLGSFYVSVKGTISARGTSENKIIFNGGQYIDFTSESLGWDELTDNGCIIENAVLNSPLTISNPAKINNDTIYGAITLKLIQIGTPVISNSIIKGGISANVHTHANITNNTIMNQGLSFGSTGNVANINVAGNIISGCSSGIIIARWVSGIFGNDPSFQTIENNLIFNNTVGITINNNAYTTDTGPNIQNNTITGNNIGLSINGASSKSFLAINERVLKNSIYSNINYSVKNQDVNNLNATYNWWGNTDTATISQTIYDFKNDFNLGTVTFTPLLNLPNTQPLIGVISSAELGGSISPSGYVIANYGSNQTFNVTANNGHHILDVKVNGGSVGAVDSYTVQNVQSATTISATFAPNPTPTSIPTPSPIPTATPSPTPTPNPTTTPSSTPTPTNLPSLKSTQISISVDASSAVVGASVNINGKLTDPNGNPLPNKAVTLSYTLTGSSNNVPIGSDTTTAAGEYNLQWVNTASGTFRLKVEWDGDSIYKPASNATVLNFLPYQNQNVFLVESNSTVTVLAFNSTSSELSFSVTGPSETTGYVKATIAKNLISNPENIKVYLDGNQLIYVVTSNADSWQLTFNYHHSTHKVSILLTEGSPIPEFSSSAIISIVLLMALTVAILSFTKNRRIHHTKA